MTTLDSELDRYLSIRRSLGFDLSTSARVLRRFVAFAHDQGTDHMTINLFLRWKGVFGSASAQTWATRAGMVRQFSQWLNGIDCKNEVLPKSLLPCRQRRRPPYIYSDQEIVQIVNEAARLCSINGIRALTYSTFFGLVAVTGLRVSEALSLDNSDVDWSNGVLSVRRGKSGAAARIIPVSESTSSRLRAYAEKRDRLLGRSPTPFFVSDDGKRPGDCSARYNFASVCQRIGLRSVPRYPRHGRGPRIHDLRHTFAVRTLVNWYRSGMDTDREMIKLSTYLGHTKPSHTYWYIEAVPELLELASLRVTHALA